MSITITVPNDDQVALRAMAKALEEIAVARGAEPASEDIDIGSAFNSHRQTFMKNFSEAARVPEHMLRGESKQAEVDTTSQQCESLLKGYEELPPVHDDDQAPVSTDSNDTPWDERIHSASKALNADGTWRLRRKPKDMDETEWAEHVEFIKTELLHGDEIREALDKAERGEAVYYTSEQAEQKMEEFKEELRQRGEPSITPAGDDFHVDVGEVAEQQIAAIPIPPLPVPPVPQVEEKTAPDGHEHAHMTFPQVMQFLTERHGRITSAQVDQIIADMGLEKITDLNTQPEHTGPFIARVKALLGE